MIIARIDDERFIDLVRKGPLIAFQSLEYGYAVAAPGEAYYAPIDHPGGGNLPPEWRMLLEHAALKRMGTPALRTLRPTAKPSVTVALARYLDASFGTGNHEAEFAKASGDHSAMAEYACQVVILAIEENERPDLKDAMRPAKREELGDALDLVIQNAESARELCEIGEEKPTLIKLYLLQSSAAMKSALEMLLRP